MPKEMNSKKADAKHCTTNSQAWERPAEAPPPNVSR